MPFFCIVLLLNFFACLCWLAPTLLAKLPVEFYTFQKEFVLASSNLFQSELNMQRCYLRGILIVSFTLVLLNFVHTSESFTLLAFLFMQEYREKKMDKKKAKKPIDQNYFHGTIKYINVSHGYLSVFLYLFYFPKNCDPSI